MRQAKRTLALMITAAALLISVSACSAETSTDELLGQIRVEYIAAEKLVMTMDVTADYGDRVYEFKLRWTGNDTSGELEVLEPEIIRGLKAQLSPDGKRLVFDGAAFDTGGITENGMSPAEIAPLMIKAWKNGYVSECSRESIDGKNLVVMSTDISDTLILRTWFDSETSLPVKAELSEDGYTVITVVFGDVIAE